MRTRLRTLIFRRTGPAAGLLAACAGVALTVGGALRAAPQPGTPTAASPAAATPAVARPLPASVQALFQKYCVDCHDPDSLKGDLDLTAIRSDFESPAGNRQWVLLHDRVEAREMPPANKPQPTDAERKTLLGWTADSLRAADLAKQQAQGRSMLRRLNRVEYQNTIHDLLHVDTEVREMLPEDGQAAGFDNVDAGLDLSSVLMEKYMEAADAALDAALVKSERPQVANRRYTYADDKTVGGSEQVVKLADGVVFTNELYPPKVLSKARVAVAGRYRIRIASYAYQSDQSLPMLIYAGSQDTQRGKTELTQAFDVKPGEPQVFEFDQYLDRQDTIRIVVQGINKPWPESAKTYKGAGLAVQWAEVDGPQIGDWPPASYTRLLGNVMLQHGTLADAEQALRRLLPRAFRRPTTDADLQPYLRLVEGKLKQGGSFESALKLGLKGVLISPEFLYLRTQPGRLDGPALASRLSYFLWSSMPDDELLALGASGALLEPAVLRKQVDRLLADPRSAAFTENFTGQWLRLRDIRATNPDKQLYPEFDALLEWSMVRETIAFFDELLRHDLSVANIIDSDWGMLNSRLAEHYNIPGVTGLQIRRTPLRPEWHRGGMMTHASVLKVSANGTNTSPILRGVFVLDRFLGQPAPPPPKNVPAVEPDTRGATTIRQQLDKHRNVAACASCHVKIDPPGYAMECFDPIGGYREHYRILTSDFNKRAKASNGSRLPYAIGGPVDNADKLPDGREFTGIGGFKQLVLTDRSQIARAMAEKLLVYATGHPMTFADRERIKQLVEQTKPRDYGLRSLIHELVQSETFRSK